MATITIAQARYLGNADGHASVLRGGPQFPNIKETASQTYAQGAPVYRDSNGTIAVVVASSDKIDYIAGFALTAATGTTGASVRYRPMRVGDRYVVSVSDGSGTGVTALTQVGARVNFDIASGNLLTANIATSAGVTADGTKVLAMIEELYTVVAGYQDGDVVGDTSGRVIVRILPCFTIQG